MKEIIKQHEEKMGKTIDVLSKELAAIRAGRANPGVLNKLTVEYYGTPTPLPFLLRTRAPCKSSRGMPPFCAILKRQSRPLTWG